MKKKKKDDVIIVFMITGLDKADGRCFSRSSMCQKTTRCPFPVLESSLLALTVLLRWWRCVTWCSSSLTVKDARHMQKNRSSETVKFRLTFFFFFFFCLKPMMTMICDVSFFATGGNSSIVSGLLFENLPPRLFPSRPSAHRLSIYLRQIESSRTWSSDDGAT